VILQDRDSAVLCKVEYGDGTAGTGRGQGGMVWYLYLLAHTKSMRGRCFFQVDITMTMIGSSRD
jgi:hypothetical protein